MKKSTLALVALAILMSACTKPNDPKEIHFSILGDSFSTFEGYVTPDANDVWYYERIGVTSVEQMWWHKMASEMEWILDKNNSFSGSLICNFWGFNAGLYYKPHSFINRMDNLGDPDVIFIQGGTNDVWNGAYHGEFVYSDWTEGDLEYYRPALAYMFDSMKRLYPKAKLYFMIDMGLCDYDPVARTFVEDALKIANPLQHRLHQTIRHPQILESS